MNLKHSIDFIKDQFGTNEFIPLHAPTFGGNEKKYLLETIDSTFVSSVGQFVDQFEQKIAEYTSTKKGVAVVNGTAGIQVALRLAGVQKDDEVITQALTFIATANAIVYNGASPIFIDVDIDTMGLSPKAVELFLEENAELRDNSCFNKKTGKRIAACLPMHTFGFPIHMDEMLRVCAKWKIPVVEDAAESLGSSYKNRPTGSMGELGVFSFNGNKVITSGGGGVIVTNHEELGLKAKHLTTTAKIPHPFEYVHDDLGYNFRMPNLNAALACAQMEQLDLFLGKKRVLAENYKTFFDSKSMRFRTELEDTQANYWLMCLELEDQKERDAFLKETNANNVMTRPIWQLMFRSNLYVNFQKDEQKNALFLEERIVNIPSSVI